MDWFRSAVAGSSTGVKFDIGAVGEKPVQSDQYKVGEDLLFDATLGLAVKVFDFEDTLTDLVKFLDAPSAMVNLDERLQRKEFGIEQGGTQAEYGLADFVFEQA